MTTAPQHINSIYRDVLAAAMILTRIPIDWPQDAEAPDSARSYWAFGIIGVGVAAIPAVIGGLLIMAGIPSLAGAALALFGIMLMTGGLHQDGLADLADSLGGRDRDHRLTIMHDSAIGSFGTFALISIVIIDVACLAHLAAIDPFYMIAGLLATSGMSRSMMAFQRWHRPTPTAQGLASITGKPDQHIMIIGVLIGLLVGLIFIPASAAFISIIIGLVISFGLGAFMMRWIGGVNGDGLGATQQITEAAMLMVLAIAI